MMEVMVGNYAYRHSTVLRLSGRTSAPTSEAHMRYLSMSILITMANLAKWPKTVLTIPIGHSIC